MTTELQVASFDVGDTSFRHWRDHEDKLKAMKKIQRAFHGAKTGGYRNVKEQLVRYIRELRQDGCAVSLDIVQTEVHRIAQAQRIEAKALKASSGWTTRFMRRHGLALRRRTTLCQRLAAVYEAKELEGSTADGTPPPLPPRGPPPSEQHATRPASANRSSLKPGDSLQSCKNTDPVKEEVADRNNISSMGSCPTHVDV
ncbi:hypothetical protein HPB51_023053 [Rhipicephalus microplus]|uniref:HTH CENPB-type domain-containing protein n=1 Tax=Rhipicephalus microplus TaxID=6941 RepID=A0A9J6DJQ9_RHIMP|nr:hypothetical protein HPB51_023053 [Rhipicephalus microplus]